MKNSYSGQKAILFGNGINRSSKAISWGDLLKDLVIKYSIDVDLQNELKPFPLSFEEMLSNKGGITSSDQKLRNLKNKIAELIDEDSKILDDYSLFQILYDSTDSELLTTNYDYCLENIVKEDFQLAKRSLSLDNIESKHSLFRGYEINGKKIRHIHGELKHNRNVNSTKHYASESIMIGFEHYLAYLHKIQDNVQGYKDRDKSVLYRIKENSSGICWCDFFFTHDLHILGLGFDFSEHHLWWLLIYRIQQKRKENKYDVKINNKIYFYYSEHHFNDNIEDFDFMKRYSERLLFDRNRAIADMLKSLDVIIKPLPIIGKDYKGFYERCLREIRQTNR